MPDVQLGPEPDRSSILDIASYEVALDLAGDADAFVSRSEIRFGCRRAGALVDADLRAVSVRHATLNGTAIDITRACRDGRLELGRLAADNVLVVEAEFEYVTAGAGLHRVRLPDGSECVYSKAFPAGAPGMYCCFDQPDLRAPFTVSVNAPARWSCMANGLMVSRPAEGETGQWRFATTLPLAPYLANVCAGPYAGPAFSCERGDEPPVVVTARALPSAAALLEAAMSPALFAGPLSYYESGLGAAYPYGKCDFVFVPGFPGLAFGAPGLVTIKDQVLTDPSDDNAGGLYLATVIAHELAHAWFGGLIDMCQPDDAWLMESLTTYISRTALEQLYPAATPWDSVTSRALPDDAYAADAATIKHLEALIGHSAVLAGLRRLLASHPQGQATKDDLVRCWSQASGRDLREWAAETLTPTAKGTGQDTP